MKLHGNAALSWSGRRRLAERLVQTANMAWCFGSWVEFHNLEESEQKKPELLERI